MRTTRARAKATAQIIETDFSTPPDIVRRRRKHKIRIREEQVRSPSPIQVIQVIQHSKSPTPSPPPRASTPPPAQAPLPLLEQLETPLPSIPFLDPSPVPSLSPHSHDFAEQLQNTPVDLGTPTLPPSQNNHLSFISGMATGFFASISSFSPFKRNVNDVAQSSPSPAIAGDDLSLISIEEEATPKPIAITVSEEIPQPQPQASTSIQENAKFSALSFLQPLPPPTQSVSTPRRKQLPFQPSMLTGKKRALRAKYQALQEEKALRKEGLKPTESKSEKASRYAVEREHWLMDAHEKARRKEPYDDEFHPDSSSAELGSKRKNVGVGKTFSVPEPESADSESEVDPTSPSKPPTQPRPFLIPKSPSKRTPSPIPPTPIPISHSSPSPFDAPTPSASAIMSSPPRVGRTYGHYDSITETSDVMSVDEPQKPYTKKSVAEWTPGDRADYLKDEYGFDPKQLLKELEYLERGEIPPSLDRPFQAIQDAKNRALLEHERRMTGYETEIQNMEQIVSNQRLVLADEEDAVIKQRALVRAQYNGETLNEQINHNGPRDNNELGFPYCSPDTSTTLDNVFATAAVNKAENVNAARPTEADISTPTPSTYSKPSSQFLETPSKLPSVTWAENVVHNHAAPGPNEPVKSNTPAPKSALKGHQLQSLERKMNEATRYTPKQPSRLREVSEVAKPVANTAIPLSFINHIPFKIAENPYQHVRDSIHTYYDEMPSGFENLWAGTSMEASIAYNPYASARQAAISMAMQLESQH